MKRPSWPEYFMQLARVAATRSTCERLHVGCVLERDRQVLASGYNGSLRGAAHCDDVGHQHDEGSPSCVRTVHAEVNAIASAARRGVALEGATAWLTDSPCRTCARLLAQSGVVRVVYEREYRIVAHLDELRAMGVAVERFSACGASDAPLAPRP